MFKPNNAPRSQSPSGSWFHTFPGKMAAHLASRDWCQSAVGHPDAWACELRMLLGVIFASKQPSAVFWGAEQMFLCNDGFWQLIGPDAPPFDPDSAQEQIWGQSWRCVASRIDQVMRDKGAIRCEGIVLPASAGMRPAELSCDLEMSPVSVASGGVGGVVVFAVDQTDAMLTRRELTRTRQRQHELFEQAPGFACLLSGPDHRFEMVNAAYFDMIGHRDIIGKPVRVAMPEVEGQGFLELLDTAYRTGQSHAAEEVVARVRQKPDGGFVEYLLNFYLQPIIEHDGTVSGIFFVGHDITERQSARLAARQAQEFSRALLENISEGVFGLAEDGRIISVNPAALRLLNKDRDTILGAFADDFIGPLDGDMGNSQGGDGLSPIQLTLADFRTRRVMGDVCAGRDGISFPVEYTIAVTERVADNDVPRFVVSFRDITPQQDETRLRDLETFILKAVGSGEPLDGLLTRAAGMLEGLFPNALASIRLLNDGCLTHLASPRMPEPYLKKISTPKRIALGGLTCVSAAATGRTVICPDIAADPAWADLHQITQEHGLAACWSNPVFNHAGDVIATFTLYPSTPRVPDHRQSVLMDRVAAHIGLAVERTREADALRRSEEHFRTVYDLVPVLIWEEDWADVKVGLQKLRARGVLDLATYLDANPDFVSDTIGKVHVRNANRAAAEMFGAQSPADLLKNKDILVAEPGMQRAFRMALVAYYTGQPSFETENSTIDLLGRSLDLLVRVSLPPFESDQTTVVLCELDITKARIATERFQLVASITSDVIWDWDIDAGRVWCSDGLLTVFGHDPEDIRSRRCAWADYLHPEERNELLAEQASVFGGETSQWDREYRLRRGDGSYAMVADKVTVIRNANGKPMRLIGSMVDITERRLTEEKLKQSQRLDAVGRLTGGVAHDFNNLLTVVLGNTELLLDDALSPDQARRLNEVNLSALDRAASLTGQLLAFARQQPLRNEKSELNAGIRKAHRLFERTLSENIDIRLELSPQDLTIEADMAQFDVALLNLVVNARDAMPDGGKLVIATSRISVLDRPMVANQDLPPGDFAVVSVTDTGTGMSAETSARAFEPFFTTKEIGEGSGMGLSLVWGYAKQSGGHAVIMSERGIGTTVRLYFPLVEAENIDADQPTIPNAERQGNEHVLLVEDEPMVRNHVAAQLVSLGYRVTSADKGSTAMALLASTPDIDLVFTDVVMPGGMNGRQLAEAATRLRPDLKVLFTSGYSQDALMQNGRFDLTVHLLPKPYRRKDLAEKLRLVLDS